MTYSAEALAKFPAHQAALVAQHHALFETYMMHRYVTDRGREFGQHGFCRRLNMLRHCVEQVFRILPPEVVETPDDNTRRSAEAHIHAFVLHVFGAADNLAWIWVSEKSKTRSNGSPFKDSMVGIRKKNVIETFRPEFRDYLDTLEPWFTYLESFRHTLAHRVPLYIPPYIVFQANAAAYDELARQAQTAWQNLNVEEYHRLRAEQEKLGVFRALMQQSQSEEPRPVGFHSQMLADFTTVDELGRRMIIELAA